MRFGKYGACGRAVLLGTSALVASAAPAVSADFDIMVDTVANQTLGANETGRVRLGVTLSSTAVGPAVDIVGPGATLTNEGTIRGVAGSATAHPSSPASASICRKSPRPPTSLSAGLSMHPPFRNKVEFG